MLHLDTGFLIRALGPGTPEDRQLRVWLRAGEAIAIAAPAWAEFLCGPVSPAEVAAAARLLGAPVTFGGDQAAETARLFNAAGRRRGTLVDCMIAATAIGVGATLATTNPDDFKRLLSSGLVLAT